MPPALRCLPCALAAPPYCVICDLPPRSVLYAVTPALRIMGCCLRSAACRRCSVFALPPSLFRLRSYHSHRLSRRATTISGPRTRGTRRSRTTPSTSRRRRSSGVRSIHLGTRLAGRRCTKFDNRLACRRLLMSSPCISRIKQTTRAHASLLAVDRRSDASSGRDRAPERPFGAGVPPKFATPFTAKKEEVPALETSFESMTPEEWKALRL